MLLNDMSAHVCPFIFIAEIQGRVEMIDQETIRKANADIAGVLGRYNIKLQKKGGELHALCPFHNEKSPSFTVKPSEGFYHCFGCGASGNAITFVMEIENIGFRDAVEKITGNLPADFDAERARASYKTEQADEWIPESVVPSSAPNPPSIKWMAAPSGASIPKSSNTFVGSGGDVLVKHEAIARYPYRNADGSIAGYTLRFNCAWGGKEIIPQTWCKNTKSGEFQWRWLSFPKPRLMYNLDKLAKHPNAQVVMAEGEKACDAAQSLYEGIGISRDRLIVLSWAGGGKAVKHTDFAPLSGRSVGFWPDADKQVFPQKHPKEGQLVPYLEQPGVACMLDIAGRITNPKKLQIFVPPEGVPDGWDLADKLPEGLDLLAHTKSSSMTIPDFIARFTPVVVVTPPPAPEPSPAPAPAVAELPPVIDEPEEQLDDLIKNSEFTVLGYDGDDYYFFHHRKKQVLRRTKGDFSETGLNELADINWWETNFPAKEGFNRRAAVDWIFKIANSRGIYDPTRVRGRGAWIDKGRLVFHHGKHLSINGEYSDITNIKSAFVYPLARSMPDMLEPLSDAEGKHLVRVAMMPRWAMPGSAALMAGWAMLAPICGALTWRPHIWITGAAGSGKTSIQLKYCGGLTRGISVYANGNSTEAGIRQELKCDARPVMVDEFESNNEREKQRVENVMSLIRQTSSETQAKTYKGTASGTGMQFDVRSMFCLASINTNLPTKADIDRLSILSLKATRNESQNHWPELEAELNKIDEDGTLAGRLLSRCLTMMPVILASIKVFRRVAATAFKSQRDGDQYGTLLAGCWCLAKHHVPSDEEAVALIGHYDWSQHREGSEEDDAMRALEAILSAKLRVALIGELSVYELIREILPDHRRDTVAPHVADATLKRHGIRVEKELGQVWFGSSVSSLKSLVEKMSFVTDLRGQLLRVKGAERIDTNKKFNGVDSKVVAVPLWPIFAAEATGDADLDEIPF